MLMHKYSSHSGSILCCFHLLFNNCRWDLSCLWLGCWLSHEFVRWKGTLAVDQMIVVSWSWSLSPVSAVHCIWINYACSETNFCRVQRRLTLFGHLVRMDETADARRILTAVPQSEWRRPVGRPYTSWMATLKIDLTRHNLTLEDAIELALNKPLWRLLAASGATHWWCMRNNDDEWHTVWRDEVSNCSLFCFCVARHFSGDCIISERTTGWRSRH